MLRVKVCGLSDPLNVKLIAEIKPDFMGFIFYKGSPRYVGDEPAKELFQRVPQGIKRTGVFLNESNSKIVELALSTGLDTIQLHGSESPAACSQLKSAGLTIVKAFNIDQDFDFESLIQYLPVCDYFLFDTKSEKHGGSGRKFNWEKLIEYKMDKPFFLSGGIGPDDPALIKSLVNEGFFGVDVNSRFETSPGIKDFDILKAFIQEIKNDQL